MTSRSSSTSGWTSASEFTPHALDTLRQPLEDGVVTVARIGGTVRRGCRSVDGSVGAPGERACYLGRLAAPLLDRIDLQVEVGPVRPALVIPRNGAGSKSAPARERVTRARGGQRARLRS